jgi:hydrogenase maturation protease
MTDSFIENLSEILIGNVAFLGIGNIDRGDDGAGMALARLLSDARVTRVYDGGMTPEKYLSVLRDNGCDTIVFLDAVEMGAQPGSLTILDAQEIEAKFPVVSTHKLSLGMLARLIAEGNNTKVWLIGVQPLSIEMGAGGLSPLVEQSVTFAAQSIATLMALRIPALQELVCT